MNSSDTLSWETRTIQKLSGRVRMRNEFLMKNSTSELVEFYWSNQKRFSRSYSGFPVEVK